MDSTDRLIMMLMDNNPELNKWTRDMIEDEGKRCELYEMSDGTRRLGIDLDRRVCERIEGVFEGYHEERRPFGRVIACSAPSSVANDAGGFYYRLNRAGCELVKEVGTLRDIDWTRVVDRLVDAVTDEDPVKFWERHKFTTQAEKAREEKTS